MTASEPQSTSLPYGGNLGVEQVRVAERQAFCIRELRRVSLHPAALLVCRVSFYASFCCVSEAKRQVCMAMIFISVDISGC